MSPTVARSAQAAVAGVTGLLGTLAGSPTDQIIPWVVTDFNGTATQLFTLPGDYKVGVQNFYTHDLTPGNRMLPRCHSNEDVLRERYGEAGATFHQLMCTGRREIAASMFYPACEAKDKLLKKPAPAYAMVFENSILDTISTRVLGEKAVLHNIESWALRGAPICPSTYDLIMLSPPVGGQRQVYTEIASQLASLGFLVVTVDHPSLSGAVEMSDGSFLYNVAGEAIDYRESELIQVANIRTVMDALVGDELPIHSPLWTHEAMVSANNTCVLGHGVGGRVSMLMVANRMVSCGMVLDDRMPMPGPFSPKNTPASSKRPQNSSDFTPDSDEDDLGTMQPLPEDVIQELPNTPMLRKIVGLAKGAADYAATGIFKLVCYLTNQDCSGEEPPEKRSLSGEIVSNDLELSSYGHPKEHYEYGDESSYDFPEPPYYDEPSSDPFPHYGDKPSDEPPSYEKPSSVPPPYYEDRPSYDKPSYDKPSYDRPSYDKPPKYEEPYAPEPYEGDDSNGHYPYPPEVTPPQVWPPPGVFPPGHVPPPPPPPSNNHTNGTNPPYPPPRVPGHPHVPGYPPQVPEYPPRVPEYPPRVPEYPTHVPSYPPVHGCSPDCHNHEKPEPCCPVKHQPSCPDKYKSPCCQPHGHEDDEDDSEHWEYEWDHCDDKEGKDTEEDEDESEDLQENVDGDDGDDGDDGSGEDDENDHGENFGIGNEDNDDVEEEDEDKDGEDENENEADGEDIEDDVEEEEDM